MAAPALLRDRRWRVLIDAVLAGIVDPDDDDRRDRARRDQLLRCLVHTPFFTHGSGAIEHVLPVVQVENRISVRAFRIVVGRKVDQNGAIVLQVRRVKSLVRANVAGECVLGVGLRSVGH